MTNFNAKHFLSFAVLVLGIFASQCLQAEAACDSAKASPLLDCKRCTAGTCVWCGAQGSTESNPTQTIDFEIGVCKEEGFDCSGVTDVTTAFSSLFGPYSNDGKVVYTTTMKHVAVAAAKCPAVSGALVAIPDGAGTQCAKCLAANVGGKANAGKFCKISIGFDGSTQFKTSDMCLSTDDICADLTQTVSKGVHIKTIAANVAGDCPAALVDGDLKSCGAFNQCAGCLAADSCKWCKAGVKNGTVLESSPVDKFGKCQSAEDTCDDLILTYFDELKPVAETKFGKDVTTTFALTEITAAGDSCKATEVDRLAFSDFGTCESCTAVDELVWCQLALTKGKVAASTTGGVCAKDAATCKEYAVQAEADTGYSMTAIERQCSSATTTSAAGPKAIGGAALLSVMVAMIWK